MNVVVTLQKRRECRHSAEFLEYGRVRCNADLCPNAAYIVLYI
jgi:hypothetical protein